MTLTITILFGAAMTALGAGTHYVVVRPKLEKLRILTDRAPNGRFVRREK